MGVIKTIFKVIGYIFYIIYKPFEIIIGGLLKGYGDTKKDNDIKKEYGLNDHEVSLVKKGLYKPNQFDDDQDELDEDDYYYGDQ